MQSVEFGMLNFIQEHLKTQWLDKIMVFLSWLGNGGMVWIAIAVICLCFVSTRKMALHILLALFLGVIIGNVALKVIIARERPFTYVPDMLLLIPRPKDYSFPSGHTLSSFAAAVTICMYYKKAGVAALCLASGITFSRLYLYVHFPTDIVGGIVLGSLLAWFIGYLFTMKRSGENL